MCLFMCLPHSQGLFVRLCFLSAGKSFFFFFICSSHNQSVNSKLIQLMCSSGYIHELLQMSFVLNDLKELVYLPSPDYITYIFVLFAIIYISVLSVALNVFYFTLYLQYILYKYNWGQKFTPPPSESAKCWLFYQNKRDSTKFMLLSIYYWPE